MTVEVCTRVGARVSPAPGSLKEESSSPGGRDLSSPARETIEVPAARPKFMITDILAQQKPLPPARIPGDSGHIAASLDEPKDLRLPRQIHPDDDDDDDDVDVDLEGEGSHDEDDVDHHEKHGDSSTDDGAPPPCKKQRKARTAFSDQQLQTLEKSFERQKYLSVQDRMELANKLNLSDTQVKTWYQNRRTKWKRQTAVGLELLAEAGNYAAVQRMYSGGYWPYAPQPPSVASAAALNPASVDLYYRQAAAAAALQKPLAYRLYPPGLPLLPAALQQDLRSSGLSHDPLRDALRPELRLDALRHEALRSSEIVRPEAFRSLVSSCSPVHLPATSLTVTASMPSSPLTSPLSSSSPLSTSGSPLPPSSLGSFYRQETSSQV